MIKNPKHQIWILPLIGSALGGIAQVLLEDKQLSLTLVISGALSGIARYLQHVLPDTGTQGLLMKPTSKQESGNT